MKINPLNDDLINGVIDITRIAGAAIMDVYASDFDIYVKDDSSPLTKADMRANTIITDGLEKLIPDVPVLSEEGQKIPFNERSKWESYWLVDPLDGTKEFIKKNNEFTVNIALLEYSQPVFGVVYAPALNILYFGSSDKGSFKSNEGDTFIPISVSSIVTNPVQIAVSRSHRSLKMNSFISQFDKYDLHPMGSSLKICSVSDGTAHFYPRLGPTMEWDTAASHAIIRAAGGELINIGTNKPLEYNKEDLLNPKFIAGNMFSIQSLYLMK
jgi:3'(2'), 5'-bisphosphate nucleotidase